MYEYTYDYLHQAYRDLFDAKDGSLQSFKKHAPLETWLAYFCISYLKGNYPATYDFGNLLPDFQSVRYDGFRCSTTRGQLPFNEALLCYIYSEFDSNYGFPPGFNNFRYYYFVAPDYYRKIALRYLQTRPDRLTDPAYTDFVELLFGHAVTSLPLLPGEWKHGRSLLGLDAYKNVFTAVFPPEVPWSRWYHFVTTIPGLLEPVEHYFLGVGTPYGFYISMLLRRHDDPDTLDRIKNSSMRIVVRNGSDREYENAVERVLGRVVRNDAVPDTYQIIALGNFAHNAKAIDDRLYQEFINQLQKSPLSQVVPLVTHPEYQELAESGLIYVNLYKITE